MRCAAADHNLEKAAAKGESPLKTGRAVASQGGGDKVAKIAQEVERCRHQEGGQMAISCLKTFEIDLADFLQFLWRGAQRLSKFFRY